MKRLTFRQWMLPLAAGLILGAAIAGGVGVWRGRAMATRDMLIRNGAYMQLGWAVGQLGMIKTTGLSSSDRFYCRAALANVVATRGLLVDPPGVRAWPLNKPLLAFAVLTIPTGPGSGSKQPILTVSWLGLHEKVKSVVLYPVGYAAKQIVKLPANADTAAPWPFTISKDYAFPVRLPSSAVEPKRSTAALKSGKILLDPDMLKKGVRVGLIYGSGRESRISVPLYILHYTPRVFSEEEPKR